MTKKASLVKGHHNAYEEASHALCPEIPDPGAPPEFNQAKDWLTLAFTNPEGARQSCKLEALFAAMITEADTCRKYVLPKLEAAGWDLQEQVTEQKSFTDGRILVSGRTARRGRVKKADYLLRYKRDYFLAVVEAKAAYRSPYDGLVQALDYARILDLPFAYATNGHGIVEHDFLTGLERELDTFPSPQELWNRLRVHKVLTPEVEDKLLTPYYLGDRVPRYYQTIAINRASEAILKGQRRVLLTLATGTGKTEIAFQIAWKLWQSRWTVRGEPRRPRVLFLADRDVLVKDPYSKAFLPFGEARHRIQGEAVTSREMYFATYQAIAEDEARPGLYKRYDPDFFDLVIVDEAHRGSADSEGSWREILDHFSGAVKLGLTATPLREDTRDTYAYYGEPVYTYTLAQGIQDGFLAPYQVRRVVTDVDAAGFRPTPGQKDAYGREIPDGEYGTKDFETVLSLHDRTRAIARHLVDYLRSTDPLAKTLVFCVDQDHAQVMRSEIARLVPDLLREYPNYVSRVTADDGDYGKALLERFQELEVTKDSPIVLTTSRLLSTGVDAPTVKNVVLARVVGTMSEFKQIIGRGTRVREDYGKLWFTILDYTGTATQKFADPEFDGLPAALTVVGMTSEGETVSVSTEEQEAPPEERETPPTGRDSLQDDSEGGPPRKYVIRGGVEVRVVHEVVQELDASGKQLRVVEFTKYTAEQVQSLYRSAEELRGDWVRAQERRRIVEELGERGIALEHLEAVMGAEDADPFDLLCHLAFGAPLLTRKQRAEGAKKKLQGSFQAYGPVALSVLDDLLERYVAEGVDEIANSSVFKLLPTTQHMNALEVAKLFGGVEKLKEAVGKLQSVIYDA